jgi:hypothetical protein
MYTPGLYHGIRTHRPTHPPNTKSKTRSKISEVKESSIVISEFHLNSDGFIFMGA